MSRDSPDGYRGGLTESLPGLLSQDYEMYHCLRANTLAAGAMNRFVCDYFAAGYIYVLRDFRIVSLTGNAFWGYLYRNDTGLGFVYGTGMLWKDIIAPTPMWFLEGDNFDINVKNLGSTSSEFKLAFHFDYFPMPTGWIRRPLLDFVMSDVTPTVNQVVTFTDLSEYGPTSWYWDFGDGVTSSEQNPTHAWTSAGTYTLRFFVTNAGGTSTFSYNVTVT